VISNDVVNEGVEGFFNLKS